MSDFEDRLRRLSDDTLTALAFFSRVPIDAPAGALDIRRAAAGWPLAGLILAAGPAAVIVVCGGFGLPLFVSAFLALATGVLMTGAFHEDGLADMFDGCAHGRSADERLAIMRDSRLGTFGAVALMFVLLIKGSALAALAADASDAVLALLTVAIVSRVAALWHWSATPPARAYGMAASAGKPDAATLQIGAVAGLAAIIAMLLGFGLAAVLALALAGIATLALSSFADRRIGGHTGDTIGAVQQVAEALLLTGLSVVSTTIVP